VKLPWRTVLALTALLMQWTSTTAYATGQYEMGRLSREASLPEAMQGRWVDLDDPYAMLVVQGGEITCFGEIIDYDYKLVTEKDGALTVELKVDDPAKEDSFQRANITGLVITPDGEFHGYNVKFAIQFRKAP
jgi:hypothetical protein